MRRLPILFLVVASCAASVRLGSIASEEGNDEPRDASATLGDGALGDGATTDGPLPTAADAAVDANVDAGPLLTLATDMAGAEWIAVGADHVTWTTSGRTGDAGDLNGHYVANKDGSNRVQIKSEPGILRGVVVDGTTFNALRWISPVSIIERASATSSQSPHVTGFFLEGYGLAADGTSLFAAATTKVVSISRTSDAGAATELLASFVKAVALTSDGDQLFVADQGLESIVRVDKATGNVVWSWPIGGAINDVATDATRVYFAGGGRAGHVLKTAQQLTLFDLPGANALAVDTSGIYYASATAILRADFADPSVTTTLASGFVSLGRIALDADFIYFTDRGSGSVYRLRK